jgi:hypothetical protein
MRVLAEPDPPLEARLPEGSVLTLVCDAHTACRIGLGVMLNRQTWVSRCELASHRDEAVVLTRRFKPDAAIVDVSDAGPFVASYIAPLRVARPAMAILLSSHCRLPATTPLSTAGAVGLLSPGAPAAVRLLTGPRISALESGTFRGYVIANAIFVREDDLGYNSPSPARPLPGQQAGDGPGPGRAHGAHGPPPLLRCRA